MRVLLIFGIGLFQGPFGGFAVSANPAGLGLQGAVDSQYAQYSQSDRYGQYGQNEQVGASAVTGDLIRFHVVANSDSDEDQALKRAVRDAILEEMSPQLVKAQSVEEARQLIRDLGPEMERIAQRVIREWGKDYEARAEYGRFSFPTKSYGSLVLPAGEYEALQIKIGKAQGSNWWCVLFPALCFVDIEHSTAVPVDGKPAVPIQKSGVKSGTENGVKSGTENGVKSGTENKNPVDGTQASGGEKTEKAVKSWVWEMIKGFFKIFA